MLIREHSSWSNLSGFDGQILIIIRVADYKRDVERGAILLNDSCQTPSYHATCVTSCPIKSQFVLE